MLRVIKFYDGAISLEYLEQQPLTKLYRLISEAKTIAKEIENESKKRQRQR